MPCPNVPCPNVPCPNVPCPGTMEYYSDPQPVRYKIILAFTSVIQEYSLLRISQAFFASRNLTIFPLCHN